ncbi:Hypothetical predicted protein [Podarcis lilfordi]|uniref:Uncharacterized protein n=1 Tax=Podarcis lilfordi TaxID=74358 RepID=A0AA35KQ83_9SAUR|nr:Hypothetical predicted protein [Podarcis lilfordi]
MKWATGERACCSPELCCLAQSSGSGSNQPLQGERGRESAAPLCFAFFSLPSVSLSLPRSPTSFFSGRGSNIPPPLLQPMTSPAPPKSLSQHAALAGPGDLVFVAGGDAEEEEAEEEEEEEEAGGGGGSSSSSASGPGR